MDSLSDIRVIVGNILKVDGDVDVDIIRIENGEIITVKNGNPPENGMDLVCPSYYTLKWAGGCPYRCVWCKYRNPMRFNAKTKSYYHKRKELVLSHVMRFLYVKETPSLLNAGATCDSLINEINPKHLSLGMDILPVFVSHKMNPYRHKLLVYTRGVSIQHFIASNGSDVVKYSCGLNAETVSKRWEIDVPKNRIRITAARNMYEAGYDVRVKIGPIVPIRDWKKEYGNLMNNIIRNFKPERVTLRSLTGTYSSIKHNEDKTWALYLKESYDGGRNVPKEQRYEIYTYLMDILDDHGIEYGLCKETLEMWNALDLDYRKIKCNCVE